MDPLGSFSAATRAWFERTFDAPTPAQALGWPAIASGEHVLIQAPTGSGKTLAAFLSSIDRLNAKPGEGLRAALRLAAQGAQLRHRAEPARAARRARVVAARRRPHRRHAREGAARAGQAPAGHPDHDARVALPAAHLGGARDAARGRDADPRRGARRRRARSAARTWRSRSSGSSALAQARSSASASRRRSGRSRRSGASSRAGGRSSSSTPARARSSTSRSSSRSRTCASSARPRRSRYPVPADGQEMDAGTELGSQSIWPSIYPEILAPRRGAPLDDRLRQQPPPRGAARAAPERARRAKEIARAHHGSLAREQRVIVEEDLKARPHPVPRRHLVARARDRHGRRRPRDPGRVAEVGRARPAADRPRRARAGRRLEGPHLPEVPRRPARVGGRRAGDARGRDRGDEDPAQPARRARAADRRDLAPTRRSRSTSCTSWCAARTRSPTSRASSSRTCSTCSPAATRPTSSPSCGRASSGTAPAARSAPARGAAARGHERGHDPRPRPVRRVPGRTAAAASASSTRRWSTRRARARRSCSARRPGGSRRSRATA